MKKLFFSIFSFYGEIGRKECGIKAILLLLTSLLLFFCVYLFTSSFCGIFLKPETFVRFNDLFFRSMAVAWGSTVSIGLCALFSRRLQDINLPAILAVVLLVTHLGLVVYFYEMSDTSRIISLLLLCAVDIAIPVMPKIEPKKEEVDHKRPANYSYQTPRLR